MLNEFIHAVNSVSDGINFCSSLMLFIGGGYVALHSREMPKWAVTCLWYVGLAGLLNAFTFLIGWVFGQTHPMSHFQIGNFTETVVNTMFAVVVGVMFFNTICKDYMGVKLRRIKEMLPLQKKEVPVPVRKRTTRTRRQPTVRKKGS